MTTTRTHSIFEFFDHDNREEDSTTTMTSRPYSIPETNNDREYIANSHDELMSTLSSTSINSLFDIDSPFHSNHTQPGTSTITPALSRHSSIKSRQNMTNLPKFHEQEFTNKLQTKLKIEEGLQNLKVEPTIQSIAQEVEQKSPKHQAKVVVLLVGLPASGKSTLCHQIKDFINSTTKYKCGIYNAGDVRRRKSLIFNDSDFFDPNNESAKRNRDLYATITLNHLLSDLDNTVDIGLLDATNTTIERRQKMLSIIHSHNLATVVLEVQSKYHDYNIVKGKVHNADYIKQDRTAAINDFKRRLQHYKKVYEPVSWEELDERDDQVQAFIKCVDAGEDFELIKNKQVEEKELEAENNGVKENEFWYFKVLQQFIDQYDESFGIEYRKKVNDFYSKGQGKRE
ncbi:hypothetical protein CANMA_000514 [Candida margitis]|uniref:uncharacterized protein n=1 Tax=Candida margitis TaxID=1775924 RepID=UPI002227BF59|nr:uncharacterized protein CANMA_000514 [Candida margitis]KAI5970463.1 hypothetical protein CANMA_000514 [Candida margitis]